MLGSIHFRFDEVDWGGDNCSNRTLALSENCTVQVAFWPASFPSGVRSWDLIIPSNDLDTPTLRVPLTGTTLTLVAVSGLIQDSNKLPVKDVIVEARDLNRTSMGTALTDEEGIYQLELPPGKHTLTPTKEGSSFNPQRIEVVISTTNKSKINFKEAP